MPEQARGLTTQQVADLIGFDRSTVSRIPREKLHYRQSPGGHRRYTYADVRAYAAANLMLELPAVEPAAED